MLDMIVRALRAPKRFAKKTDGSATVEAVLWFPIFILVFGLMVDATMIFHGQAKVLRVIQDGNRNFSIGRLTTETETEDFIEAELAAINITGVASTVETAGVAYTVVTIQANELQLLGYFSGLVNLELKIGAEHMIENWEV